MKCPRDRKTEMVKSSDFVDWCPHCGVEKYAVERCIRAMMKEDYDWSLPLSDFKEKYCENTADSFFDALLLRAYSRRPSVARTNTQHHKRT